MKASIYDRLVLVVGLLCVLLAVGLLAGNARQVGLLLTTFQLAFQVCLLSLPIGAFLAWVVVRSDLPGRRLVSALLVGWLFLPLYLHAAAWEAGFGKLGWWTLASQNLQKPWLSGWNAVVWTHAAAAVPWTALIVGAGLRWSPRELEEASLLDGSGWSVWRKVVFPQWAPWLGMAAWWTVLSVAGEMTVSDLYAVRTFAEEIYIELALGDEAGDLLAPVGPGVLLQIGLTLLVLQTAIFAAAAPLRAELKPPLIYSGKAWRWAAWLVLAAAILLLVGVPLGNLIYKAGAVAEQLDGQRLRYWSAEKFQTATFGVWWTYRREFFWTLAIGSSAATAAVLLAAPLAWWGKDGGLKAWPALFAASIGWALPAPLVGLLVGKCLNQPDWPFLTWLYDRTIVAPAAGQALRALPIAIVICWCGWRTISPQQLDSASTEGAGPCRRWLWIVAASRWNVLAAAWVAALAISANDLAASILTVPPGISLTSICVYELLHAGVDERASAIALAAIVFFAGAAAMVKHLVDRDFR